MSEQSTSHAKGISLGSESENSLDRTENIGTDFNSAASEQSKEPAQANDGHGSDMVKDAGAANNLRPPPEMAEEQDRASFDEKWSAEQEKADLRDKYRAAIEEQYEKGGFSTGYEGNSQSNENSGPEMGR